MKRIVNVNRGNVQVKIQNNRESFLDNPDDDMISGISRYDFSHKLSETKASETNPVQNVFQFYFKMSCNGNFFRF